MTDEPGSGRWPAGGEALELKSQQLHHLLRQALDRTCARCLPHFTCPAQEQFASLTYSLLTGVAALPQSSAKVQERLLTDFLISLGRRLVEKNCARAGHLQQLLTEGAVQEPWEP